MQGSGNNPPWKLDSKARYAAYDGERAQKYFRQANGGEFYGGGNGARGEGELWQTPSFFPILSLLVSCSSDPI